MNLRPAIKRLVDLGGRVRHRPKTGELFCYVPGRDAPLVLNLRRKDAPRCLLVALRRLAQPKELS